MRKWVDRFDLNRRLRVVVVLHSFDMSYIPVHLWYEYLKGLTELLPHVRFIFTLEAKKPEQVF